MRRSITTHCIILTSVFLLMSSVFFSCASVEKLEEEISGTWQRTEGDGVVAINLADESKSIVIGGKTYPAAVENVDIGTYLVSLKVKTESGPEETWTLRQVWNNNGSNFKLVFNHNGTQETLVHEKHS
jgi:hypothetical protein